MDSFKAEGVSEKKPILIIGDDINYPPYSYVDSNNKPAGFNIDIAKAVGEAMGYEVEIRLDEWSKTRRALENGEIDAIAGMFYAPEREKIYSFTTKHSIAYGDIFTKKSINLNGLEDLRGKTVVVQKADIISEYLLQSDLNIKLIEVPTVDMALDLVESGTYDYAGILKLPGVYSMKDNNLKDIQAQDLRLIPNDYSMAVKSDNKELLIILNGGLQIIKATGEYQQIYDKWLGVYEEKTIMDQLKLHRWVMIIFIVIILGLIVISITLKKLVNIKTHELQEINSDLQKKQEELTSANEEMEASLEEIIVIEEELRDQFNNLTESETKLKVSEEKNKAIINALPDIVFTFDGDGRFLDCQASNSKDLLLPLKSFCGRLLGEVLPDNIASTGYEKIRAAIETGVLQSFEYELILKGVAEIFEMRITLCGDNEVIGITRNISKQRFYQERIEYLSYHDQLTGLYNRRFFDEELLRLDNKRDLPLCIMMADVNGLKLVNDSFGHKKGDELLIKVAEVLKKACFKDEIISRIGGDEFLIIIPRMKKNQADKIIDCINFMCSKEKVGSVELSVSIGWEAKYREEEDIREVFNQAENFMYKRKLFESPSMRGKTISAIINTLYEKNKREEQHSQRVSELCKRLAQEIGLSERDVEVMKTVGLLHDIGKIAINEELLNRPGLLTREEYDEVKRHPEIGYRILSSVNDMADMADYVLSHHERWDGSGYPKGLKGLDIPIQSRMIAIADAFDSITSDRSYRPARSEGEAVRELIINIGTQFDPNLIEPFIRGVIGYKDI